MNALRTYKGRDFFIGRADETPRFYYHDPEALFNRSATGTSKQIAILGAGRADDVEIFTAPGQPGIFYIYSAHDGLEYMSLTMVDSNDPGEHTQREVFIETWEFRQLEHLTPIHRSKSMMECFL